MSKVILITGATDGIGKATAEQLAKAGHTLLLHGRSQEKLELVTQSLVGIASISTYLADLTSLDDINSMCERIITDGHVIDVLINNAGILNTAQPLNSDGLDVRFMVNTIAPYMILKRLQPALSSGARILNLSSAAQQSVNISALKGEEVIPEAFNAYAQSKLAVLMWNQYLSSQPEFNDQVLIGVNPGSLLGSKMVKEGFGIAGKDISIGADILVRLAIDARFADSTGLYFDNDEGDFAPLHPDVLDEQRCLALIEAMESIIH